MSAHITKNLLTFSLYFVKQFKWCFFAMACFRMCFVLDNVVVPCLFKVFISRLTTLHPHEVMDWKKFLVPLLTLLLVIVTIDILFRLFDYVKIKTIPAFEAKIRIWVVAYLQQHAYPFFLDHFSGDLGKRVEDLTIGISDIMINIISSILPALSTMLFGILSFFYIQPVFGFIPLVWLILHTLVYIFYAQNCVHDANLHAKKLSFLSGSIVDGFSNILSIKLFARKNQSVDHLSHLQVLESQAQKKFLTTVMKLHFIISSLAVTFMGIGLLLSMIYYWQRGKLAIAELTYIFYTGSNICKLVWETVSYLPDFLQEVGFCKQALASLKSKHKILDLPHATGLHCQSAAAIEFKEIGFSYVAGNVLFHNQSVVIKAGEKVGLVGLSGSGKTTFVKLLLRFFDLNQGVITIDGQDIATITQESLYAAISFIPQDSSLFHTTIIENIRYARKEATDEEVIACAKKIKCHDFIMNLPEGYQTLVGERGSKLSGGQRQRIAIARALLKNAPILILDEATSALDSITEAEIQESLAIAMADKTVLVIAHRLSVLSAMDRILVFERGNIVAKGPHDLLLATSPLYASICRMQSEGIASMR